MRVEREDGLPANGLFKKEKHTIHSFNKHMCWRGTVLGPGDTAANKTIAPVLMKLMVSTGEYW